MPVDFEAIATNFSMVSPSSIISGRLLVLLISAAKDLRESICRAMSAGSVADWIEEMASEAIWAISSIDLVACCSLMAAARLSTCSTDGIVFMAALRLAAV